HFLIHALNLGGRYQDSMKWVQHLFTLKETPREKSGNTQQVPWRQGYFGLIKTLVRFERWEQTLDAATIPLYDKPEQNAWRHWAISRPLNENIVKRSAASRAAAAPTSASRPHSKGWARRPWRPPRAPAPPRRGPTRIATCRRCSG